MSYYDDYDDVDNDIFAMYGIETFSDDGGDEFEGMGSFSNEEEEE